MEWCGSSPATFSPCGPCGPGGPGLPAVEKEYIWKAGIYNHSFCLAIIIPWTCSCSVLTSWTRSIMRTCPRERQNVNGLGVINCDSHAVWMHECVCVCVCAALPAGPGLPGGPANGCMKEDHACNWNIRISIHTVN